MEHQFNALSENNMILPENMPVEANRTKYIFRVEKRENEEDLQVLIEAKVLLKYDDCNNGDLPGATLTKTSGGYYLMSEPGYMSTRKACYSFHTEDNPLWLSNHKLPYDSCTPIVIHAHKDVYMRYTIQDKSTPDVVFERAPRGNPTQLTIPPTKPKKTRETGKSKKAKEAKEAKEAKNQL